MPKPKPNEEMVRVNFTLPKSLKEEWTNRAKQLNMSVSQMVRKSVDQFLKKATYFPSFKLILAGNEEVMEDIQLLKNKYFTGVFNPAQNIAMGVEFFVKDITLDDIGTLKLQVWSFEGEDKFRFLFPTYVNGANGAILFFKLTSKKTFENLEEWLKILRSFDSSIPIMLVGFENDGETDTVIKTDEIIKIAKDNKFKGYVQINPKAGKNVKILFETISRLMYQSKTVVIL